MCVYDDVRDGIPYRTPGPGEFHLNMVDFDPSITAARHHIVMLIALVAEPAATPRSSKTKQ